ncbi:hypothetical protein L1987_13899 [Smallanthus sonchifolius]|uniref:Uncharacterized protein n=1 Tax=Smallanthus sonchifolius TaxID=185202 RepID=A0ACB9JHP8_9ASTR|nr:hypothetical protein L1987_13899 [Smallanthus sonchifolius]
MQHLLESDLGASISPVQAATGGYDHDASEVPRATPETPLVSNHVDIEVEATVQILNCIGIDLKGFESQVADIILGEGANNSS